MNRSFCISAKSSSPLLRLLASTQSSGILLDGYLVETADKTRFLVIADLVEDVDAIQEIRWSPDSQIVVFLSRCYLTATRVSDWQTIRIYLGKEWVRSQPAHGSTFRGAQPIRTVNEIRFPTPDTVAYLTNDRQDWCFIQMNSGRLPSRKLSKAQERKQNHNAPDKSDGARNT